MEVAEADPQATVGGTFRAVHVMHAQGALPMLMDAVRDGGARNDHVVRCRPFVRRE